MGHDDDLSVEVSAHARGVLVVLRGDVDVRAAGTLRSALHDALGRHTERIVLDLGGLTWIDSVGLGVLVAAWKRARAAGTDLVLWRPSSKALAVLRLARLDRVMTVELGADSDPFAA
ncbi:STAS domain-containing protein [Nocardioides litoris]|uniref:STAS domain-containing protein n=1 Tax=Nocardioides litoris TaxID=1926648 RepID=UPI001123D646|nr:STAS domain-containing protein [Nocardioides litoris]